MVDFMNIMRKLPFERIGRVLGYAGIAAAVFGLFPNSGLSAQSTTTDVLHWLAVAPLLAGMAWLYLGFALWFIEVMLCDPMVWCIAIDKSERYRDVIPNYIREWMSLISSARNAREARKSWAARKSNISEG